ncbi:ATP-binding protein [Ovoidimarina sediminis]|uniref:ATP-binding protein n=1 Tax=Ovoidimarina sediminis TaxID=3079856 RepID=UPI002908EF03|nr:AAA family ATPase [Rhodophyticola sp. MJ-SS7]MDU8946746.1 AAA family ATPase [Rhodophyticola sp. MJ-SS7]
MRLRRLDLTRFGHFTDFSLDFGPSEEGKPDLHIIFGPNEAGKTTAFDGYLSLLFGIPARSKYNFLHDYENMRIGGTLEIDDEAIDLVRIKRNKGDLITPSGDVANPTLLLHALDGIDRDQYRAMFSLDDETIEAGGEDILASQGNLGELLFSAAAGLSDLGSVLDDARANVDLFHKPRARKTELAEAKRELQELHIQIRELDVPASAFRRLKDERDAAAKLLDAAKETRDGLLKQQARLEAMIECLPLLKALRETNGDLGSYAGYPSIPEGVQEEAQELKSRHVEASTRLRQSKLLLETEEAARDALVQDAAISEVGDELTILLDAPRSRAQTAEADLPKRETELEGVINELSNFAKELGVESPDEGLLPEARLAQLEEIAGNHAEAKTKLSAAKKEETDAERKLEALDADLEDEAKSAGPDEDLDTLLEAIDPEETLSRYTKATEDMEAGERELQRALENLKPWSGASSDVLDIALSEAEAERLAERWIAIRDRQDTAARDCKEAQKEHDRLAARLHEFEKDESAAVEGEAKEVRGEREAHWHEHLGALTRETAEKFHATLMRDDALQEARLGFAERLARLRELQVEVATAKAALASCEDAFKAADEALDREAKSARALLVTLHLPETYDPRDLPNWQARLSDAQEWLREVDRRKTAYEGAKRSIEDGVERLKSALSISDETPGLKDLAKRARTLSAEAARVRAKAEAQAKRREEAKEEVTRRKGDVERLSGEISDIQTSWNTEVVSLPKALQTLEDFRWKVSTLRKLATRLGERNRLQGRIEAMKSDQSAFEIEITILAERAGEAVDAAPLVLGERLRKRLDRATKSDSDREQLTEKIANAKADVRAAEADLEAVSKRIEELAALFSGVTEVQSIDDLQIALSKAAKADRLRQQSNDVQSRILNRLGFSDLDAAEELLADQDIHELEGERAALAADLKAAEADHEEKVGDLRAANDDLEKVGGDNAPAQLEEKRQTLLLDLEERARAAIRLRLGILAAEQALSAYRDEHRSKMLADTETAFSKLTAGRYRDLRTQGDGQREVLLALRERDGRSITVAEMSKGTRFQLYLALRLAGYRQYASGGTTLPFVADDIMETFDNSRTAAALGLLREISEHGQALYFTHHEHVVDLAREVCGASMTVHELQMLT